MRRIAVLLVVGLLALSVPAGCVAALAVSGAAVTAQALSTSCRSSLGDESACPSTTVGGPEEVNASTIAAPDSEAATAVAAALTAIAGGGRYIAEGNGPVNFDCSGLTAWAWRQAGVSLVDLSYTQRSQTQDVPRSMVQPGDLVFWFGGSEHHVAIITAVDGGQITIAEAANPSAGLRTRLLGGGWDDAYLTGFGRVVRG